jgi:DNA (cytosine-5)-methyltransferase 1
VKKGTLTHLDLFAGPGGVSTGFRAAGIKTIAAVEKVASCVDTFSRNHPDVDVICQDIRYVKKEHFHITNQTIDIVTAGVPCETFSTAGASSRSFYDHRQTLFFEAIRLANEFKSRYLLIENVPAIQTKTIAKGVRKKVVDVLYDALRENGFPKIVTAVLNAAEYGVPQSRERFFCLASRESSPLFLPGKSEFPAASVRDALSDLPELEANIQREAKYKKSSSTYASLMRNNRFWKSPLLVGEKPTYHNSPNHRERSLKRFSLIEPGEGLRDLFYKLGDKKVKKLQEEGVLPNSWYIQRNRRLVLDGLAPTVTSHCLDELLHPTQNRALSVREAARLQSFPDNYDFIGGPILCPHIYETQDKYEQVGDAIPPLMAYHWGKAFVKGWHARESESTIESRGGQLQLQI